MNELYELPDGWEWKKLSDIGKISTGKTPPKANKEFYENGTIRFVKPPNLQNSIEITKTINDEFITEDGAKKSTLLPKNTLMVCCIGSLGKFTLSTDNVITNQQINSIVFNEKIIHFKYGYYYGFMLEKLLNAVANEAVVKIVNKSIFSNLDIPLPPLPEQQRIVLKLDLLFEKIDRSIALHQKNMDEANAFMGSVLNDIFGELKINETISLKDITTKIGSGSTPSGGQKAYKTEGISLIRSMNVHDDGFRTKGLAFIDDNQAKKLDNVTVQENDVLLNITGASVARCCVVDKDYLPARVNQHVSILRLKDEMIPSFLHYYLISPSIKSDLLFSSSGGATREAITKSMLEEFQVPVVSLSIQEKTINYLDEISKKIEKIKQLQKEKMASLKALKASILDSAFRGEL